MAAPVPARGSTPDPTRATWTRHVFNTGFVFSSIYRGVAAVPGPICHGLGHAGTWIAHRLMRETTAALADNFRGAFPSLAPAALSALTLRTYRAYADDVIDFFRSIDLPRERALEWFERPKEYEDAFLSQLALGRGVILVTGHFGNWEMGSIMMRALDLPFTIVAMREASEGINRLRIDFRQKQGADTLEVRQSMDTALQIRRRLSQNRIVAMLMDRHVGRDRVAVQFFGRTAHFLRTPPLLAYLTGAPLLPCAVLRRADGRFEVRPGTPIVVSRDEDRDVAVGRAAQMFASHLEALIRECPHYWYQFYPYWQAQTDVDVAA
jgi:KDO2-lipid IV(A) lauroyltransferase